MNWVKFFSKSRPTPSPAVIDSERQALNKIMNICSVATASAETASLDPHADEAKSARHRFESAKRISLQLVDEIADTSRHDAALEKIIELCIKANDVRTATKLIKDIRTATIRERLLNEYPTEFY
jgi:hypothetical protein